MFIDIHVHTRKVPGAKRGGKQAYATPEQLIERYDELGIEKGVLLPGVSPECSYVPQSNEEVILISRETGRFIPFCNIDPRAMTNSPDAPLIEIFEHYKEQGCKGIGEITANLPFMHPLVQNLFKNAEMSGLPVIFHISPNIGYYYGLYDAPGLPQLEMTLHRFPKLKFFGHSQAFWAEIGELDSPGGRAGYPKGPIKREGVVPKLLRKYDNLYGDLSANSGYNALARDENYAIEFLNEFQDKLMFGTDICAPDTPTPLVDLLLKFKNEGKITNEVFNKIAKGNAIRLLSITDDV